MYKTLTTNQSVEFLRKRNLEMQREIISLKKEIKSLNKQLYNCDLAMEKLYNNKGCLDLS